MSTPEWLDNLFVRLAEELLARQRGGPPPGPLLGQARIVAHRGIHGAGVAIENTLAAFDRAAVCGLYGIELDVRFSADGLPLVLHDAIPARVFGGTAPVAALTLAEAQRRYPQLPSLAQVARRYGGRLHLMIELKPAAHLNVRQINRALGDSLAALAAGRDYHLLCDAPQRLRALDFAPPQAFLPIARLNVAALSRQSLAAGWGGITGHALLLSTQTIRRHRAAGQAVGTGFIDNAPALFRELRRGVTWLFSDRPAAVQAVVDRAKGQRRSAKP